MQIRKTLIFFSMLCSVLFSQDSMGDLVIKKDTSNKPLDEIFIPTIKSDVQIIDLLDSYSDNNGVLDLKTLLEKAKDNYSMQAKNIAIEEAEATRASIYGQYLPSVDVGYNFNHTKRSSSSALSNHQLQASANWMLFDGASREFSLLSKNSLVKAAIADKGYTQETMFLQVIDNYYSYFSLKGQIIAMQLKRINIAANLARVEVLYNSGLETIDALEALKAELSLTDYDIMNLKLSFEQVRLALSLLTNCDIEKLKLNTISEPKDEEFESLNITMLQEQANSIDYQVGTLTYYPTISLFDTYSWNFKTNGGGGNAFLSMSYPKNQNVFGVSVTWNIFNGLQTNRQKEALSLSNLQLQKNIAYAKEEQKNNIKFYKKSIDTALLQIDSSLASLKSATISFDSIASKYASNLVSYNDYLDALIKRYNAESLYIQSLNNYELQKANYIFYSGQMLLDYVK